MQEMKKRLRKKLAEKAIEKMRRNICIEYRLPYEALFSTKRKTITGYKLDLYPFSKIIEEIIYEPRSIIKERVIDK